jgi:hypothetical protein
VILLVRDLALTRYLELAESVVRSVRYSRRQPQLLAALAAGAAEAGAFELAEPASREQRLASVALDGPPGAASPVRV